MTNPQKSTGASIHISAETMNVLTSMKHWGQSYDGLIKELLYELNELKHKEDKKD
jgi:hypothetical protein